MADLLGFVFCECGAFKDRDPLYEIPGNRFERDHYIRHGPCQPSEIPTGSGRQFRQEW